MSLLPTIGAVDQDTGFYNGAAKTSYRNASTAILTNEADAPTSAKIMSFGGWVKRTKTAVYSNLFSGVISGSGHASPLYIDANDKLNVYSYTGSAYTFEYTTNRLFRDISAWYHIWVQIDSTASDIDDRVKIYVNGVPETSFATETKIADGSPDIRGYATDGAVFTFGHADAAATSNSYFADWYFIDNSAVSPVDTVGEFKNGAFIPKAYSPTFGNNGFHLKFDQTGIGTAAATTIGADSSGKDRHFTSTAGTNVVASDCALPDSPENNFNTFSSLIPFNIGTLSEGSLKSDAVNGGGSNHGPMSVFGVTSGKWFCEMYVHDIGGGDYVYAGAFLKRLDNSFRQGIDLAVPNDGSVYFEGAAAGSITGLEVSANGHIYGFAVDCDNFTAQVYKTVGGTYGTYGPEVDWSGSAHKNSGYMGIGHFGASGTSGRDGGITINYGQDPSFAGAITAGTETPSKGAGVFKLAPPSGFLAMCTGNLPEPDIGPNSDTQATDHFNTVIWTAASVDGATKTITVGFKPDFIWGKARNRAASHMLVNSTVGFTKYQPSDGANTEEAFDSFVNNAVTATGYLLDDDEDGYFNYAPDGGTADNMVAWNWKANGGTTTATISESGDNPAAVVQANPTAGFSIITYTGTGDAGTIAHGLDTAPTMMIVKNRDVNDAWAVYHGRNTAAPATDYLVLNTPAATDDSAGYWADAAPTSSVFTVHDDHSVNADGEKYVAYVFAEIDGYSKFGVYTGNASANGTYVNLGFRPAFIMIKCSSNASTSWFIIDNKRDTDNEVLNDLTANTAVVETANTNFLDFLSNGFKLRTTGAAVNGDGRTMIYMAFAEAPFKYSNAR